MEYVAILDNIRSVHNVGSIFRTADAAGCSKLYLCGITPAPNDRFGKVRPAFAKVSLGAERLVPWESVRSCSVCVQKLRREGFFICALEQCSHAKSLFSRTAIPRRVRKVAVIAGNEVFGISKSVLKKSDRVIEIPMHGAKESLNVGVAFGVAVYHIMYGRL